jgi:hypothetical protein
MDELKMDNELKMMDSVLQMDTELKMMDSVLQMDTELFKPTQKATNKNIMDMFKSYVKKPKSTPLIHFEIVEAPIEIETNAKMMLYKGIRDSVKGSEFIPNSIIPAIIAHHFPVAEIMHSFNECHLLCKIPIHSILSGAITNWEYNRPPDMARCPDIARYMYRSKKPIDTMIYLAYKCAADTFEVLDGIHRVTALRILKAENEKPLDLISAGDFGSNNDASWIYNQHAIVNIRFNAVLGDLIEIFKTLNKSQNVPDIYIRDVAKEKRDLINAIANEWQIRFKKNFSSSANPIVCNTNRNKFVDLLDKLYDKYKITEATGGLLKQALEDANTRISFNVPLKLSMDARVKCIETGCYLFVYKNDKLEEFI